MKLHRTKRSAWLALATLLLPILAACGSASTPGASTSASSSGTAASTSPSSSDTAASTSPSSSGTAASASASSSGTAASSSPSSSGTAASASTSGSTSGGSNPNAKAGVLRMNAGAEPDTIDPQKASFVDEIGFIMMNYQPLMRFDKNGNVVPGAAESMDVSADGKTYTFKLPADAKYSDGSPLTAKNFEYAWKRLADPETAGEYQPLPCGIIKGYSEYSQVACQEKTITDTLKLNNLDELRNNLGVRATDDQTLQIELTNPAPYFPAMAALWIGAPVREEDVQKGEDWWYDPATYVGNGPFILSQWEHNTRAVWKPNPNWRLGPVKLQEVDWSMITEGQVAFQAFQNGELDVLGVGAEDLATVQNDPTLSKQVVDVPGSCTFYLGFNTNKAPFDNIKVRQAFAQAFDRDAWVRDILKGLGKPTQTFIPPGFPGYQASTKYPFDPAAAKQTLADAGFPNGQGLPEIKLTFSQSARNQARFEWIANQLKQNLGISVVLDPVDPTAYTALTKDPATTPQMFFLGWCADYFDPQDWVSLWKTGGQLQGRLGWSSAKLDELTNAADVNQNQEERLKQYQDAQNILIDEAPVVFIYNDSPKMLVRPYVKGMSTDMFTPLDPAIPGFYANLQNIEVAP